MNSVTHSQTSRGARLRTVKVKIEFLQWSQVLLPAIYVDCFWYVYPSTISSLWYYLLSGGARTSRQPGHFQVIKVVRQVIRCKRQRSKGWPTSFRGRKILKKPRHRMHFIPKKLTFAICHRPFVCRLSVSITFVHLYTQAIKIFGNVSMPFATMAICWHPGKILQRSSQENPSVGGVKHSGVAECSDFGPIKRYISETVQDRS